LGEVLQILEVLYNPLPDHDARILRKRRLQVISANRGGPVRLILVELDSSFDVTPFDKGGGWHSPVDLPVLHRLVAERPDRTTDELTRAYNRAVVVAARVHRSSILRALQRSGYVFKRNDRARRNRIVPVSRPNAAPSSGGSDG